MTYSIPIPETSRLAFESHKEKPGQNAGLVFERFAPDIKENPELKEDGLQSVLKAFSRADTKLFQEWNIRWEQVVRAAHAEPFTMKTNWRLIAGLGEKGGLEVGFTFHRYGFPYLPGSSLKGLARTYGLLEIALGLESAIKNKNEKEPLANLDEILSREKMSKFEEGLHGYNPDSDILSMAQAFRQVFGTTDTAGKVIFFDAIPSAIPKLEMDIMNPHYPEYYKEGSNAYPTNWQSPIPVKFLAIASGSSFRFALGWRNSPQDSHENSEKKQKTWNGWFKGEQIVQNANPESPRLIKLARRWMQGGLLELGVGSKTNAGYGYFS